jgi:tripartite-type tricarboxylate transporter receptor subunit TctC
MGILIRTLSVALLAALPAVSHGQADFPNRPVRLLVAFAPGSPTDLVARVVGQSLGETFGKPIVVENRPGAGGIIASQTTKRANPDGYTILVTSTSIVTNVSLRADPGYKMSDFAPIAQGPITPNLIAVHPSVKANTLQELIALAKTTPMSYASSGAGTAPNLNMEQLFTVRSKVNITHVPMGPPQAVNAAAGLQVPISATAMATAVPLVKAGRIRAIAITSPRRSAILPDVATVAESGFPGFSDHTWFSFFAPVGTPPAIVNKLNAEINRIMQLPDTRARLDTLSLEFVPRTPAEFAASLKVEGANYAKMVKEAGLKIE